MKVIKIFSWPLMKQSLNANKVLFIACTLVLCLMTVVTTYANNLLDGTETVDYTDAQTDFYSHLYVLASYNEMMGTELSYEDFAEAEDQTMYETAFEMASAQSDDLDLSCENFETAAETVAESEVGLYAYISGKYKKQN